jgi:Flp pilus assembly protein TadG
MNQAEGHRHQRGTSTLEFIVVLPTVLLLFFAIMELSRAWLTVNITTTAAREAARTASVTPPDGAGNFDPGPALTRINEVLTAANMTPDAVNVVCDTVPCVAGSQVTANVQVTFDTILPVFLPMLVGLDIDRTTVMRYE